MTKPSSIYIDVFINFEYYHQMCTVVFLSIELLPFEPPADVSSYNLFIKCGIGRWNEQIP